MNKYVIAFLGTMIALPRCVYSQDPTALLHKLADQQQLTEEDQKKLHQVLEHPQVNVNQTQGCLTPLCRALYRGNMVVAEALAQHPQIDFTLPSTMSLLWWKKQLLPSPIESAAEDPAVCDTLESAVSLEKLLRAAMRIQVKQRSKALQDQIELWKQKVAIEACLKALGSKISKNVVSLLQKKSPHPVHSD